MVIGILMDPLNECLIHSVFSLIQDMFSESVAFACEYNCCMKYARLKLLSGVYLSIPDCSPSSKYCPTFVCSVNIFRKSNSS